MDQWVGGIVAGRAPMRDFARRRVPIGVSQKHAFMEGWERAEKPMIRRPCWYSDKP